MMICAMRSRIELSCFSSQFDGEDPCGLMLQRILGWLSKEQIENRLYPTINQYYPNAIFPEPMTTLSALPESYCQPNIYG
jgi:hypothetical protein